MPDPFLSEECLNAYVDGELAPDERDYVLELESRDASVRDFICQLRKLKDMTRCAYEISPPHRALPVKKRQFVHPRGLAACLTFLLIGGVSGWGLSTLAGARDSVDLFRAISRNDSGGSPSKIMIYVGNDDPIRLKTALDEAEDLLASAKQDNRAIQIEIIANDNGVNLLRTGSSAYANRIAKLQANYPNLSLVACTNTLNKLKDKGNVIRLLPNVKCVPSASSEIVQRLKEGWDYVRV